MERETVLIEVGDVIRCKTVFAPVYQTVLRVTAKFVVTHEGGYSRFQYHRDATYGVRACHSGKYDTTSYTLIKK